MSEINDIEEIPEDVFPIHLTLIDHYEQKQPILMAKYNECIYKTGYICEVSNINLILIVCRDNIVTALILQIWVLNWYHTYILHP